MAVSTGDRHRQTDWKAAETSKQFAEQSLAFCDAKKNAVCPSK